MDIVEPEEELVTLHQAARRTLPSPPSPQTLWRWHSKGLNGVRLPTIKVGRTRYTTVRAFMQFLSDVAKTEVVSEENSLKRNKLLEETLRHERLLE